MVMPETEIEPSIDQLLKNKLTEVDYERVKRYIKMLLDDRYGYWEESMGEDL